MNHLGIVAPLQACTLWSKLLGLSLQKACNPDPHTNPEKATKACWDSVIAAAEACTSHKAVTPAIWLNTIASLHAANLPKKSWITGPQDKLFQVVMPQSA